MTSCNCVRPRFGSVLSRKNTIERRCLKCGGLPHGQKKLFNFSDKTAYNKLQRSLILAGINKDISFHDLRRSFMKTAKKKGIDIKAVCQITGDTIATVQNFYQNLDMEELKEEIKKL